MRIYGYKIYEEMMAKRDKLREVYAQEEEKIFEIHNPIIANARKRAKNFFHYFIYSIVILIVVFLSLNYKLSEPGSIATLVIIGIGNLTVLGVAILFRIKRELAIKKFNEASEKNQVLKDEVIKLNKELANLAIALISYSEYHDELSLIKDEEELKRRFQEIFYLYNEEINALYNYKANVDDYLDYYFKWENNIL